MLKLLLRILISPLVVFVVALIYYGDFAKAYYLALLFYTALTLVSVVVSAFTIPGSIAKFKVLKFLGKSYKLITMLFALGVYWLIYLLFWA